MGLEWVALLLVFGWGLGFGRVMTEVLLPNWSLRRLMETESSEKGPSPSDPAAAWVDVLAPENGDVPVAAKECVFWRSLLDMMQCTVRDDLVWLVGCEW